MFFRATNELPGFFFFDMLTKEKIEAERRARDKFEALTPEVKKAFGKLIAAGDVGQAWLILTRQGFDITEAARMIMFVEELEA